MAGLGVWGLVERTCKEKGRTRVDTESAGPKRAFRRFSEVPSTTTSTVVHGVGYLGGRQGYVDGKRLREPSGVAVGGPKTNKAIYR